MILEGYLKPLKAEVDEPINYYLHVGEKSIHVNKLIGEEITINFLGEIICNFCGKKIKKVYGSSSCFVCFRKLPQNDICIVRPERCHFHKGTCRDNEFGESVCNQPHIVYLSLSSDAKVGITRKDNLLKRWIDQGAIEGLPLFEVPTRKISGDIESHLAQYIKDKTNWRNMLKNKIERCDLIELKKRVLENIPSAFKQYEIKDDKLYYFDYPQMRSLEKVTSFNLDKNPYLKDTLIGIKAQYLIFENGVLGIRKYTGYKVELRY